MIVRLIRVYVKPQAIAAFEEATRRNHLGSVAEAGVLRFDVLRNPETKGEYLLYEVYTSYEATDAHKQTSHYAEWKEAVADMMEKPRQSEAFEVVAPTDESAWRAT